jgi:hypothetical protein
MQFDVLSAFIKSTICTIYCYLHKVHTFALTFLKILFNNINSLLILATGIYVSFNVTQGLLVVLTEHVRATRCTHTYVP